MLACGSGTASTSSRTRPLAAGRPAEPVGGVGGKPCPAPAKSSTLTCGKPHRPSHSRAPKGRQRQHHDGPTGTLPVLETVGSRLVAARRPRWLLSGLVRCGICKGPRGVVSSDGRLGCANRRERGTCTNKRTMLRDRLLERVMSGLKHRLLAPELVEAFVREFVAEVNAANRENGQRQARLQQKQARLGRQIRNLLELMKDGHGSPAMVGELRELEQRKGEFDGAVASAGTPEPVPTLHPNLPELYRRKVEALEEALQDPAAASAAAEAFRSLIDAIMVYPGERRGEVSIELRGDLAAFMHEPDDGATTRTAVARMGNGRAGEVMGSLVAGVRNILICCSSARQYDRHTAYDRHPHGQQYPAQPSIPQLLGCGRHNPAIQRLSANC